MKNKMIIGINSKAGAKRIKDVAAAYASSLPAPSNRYKNIVFLYSEELATQGRDMLFEQLNKRASQLNCQLVISDIGYSRAGFYVKIDEIGVEDFDEANFDEIIEHWSKPIC